MAYKEESSSVSSGDVEFDELSMVKSGRETLQKGKGIMGSSKIWSSSFQPWVCGFFFRVTALIPWARLAAFLKGLPAFVVGVHVLVGLGVFPC